MATVTERVPVLMTPREKQRLAAKAKAAGISMSEYIRRAMENAQPVNDDTKALEAMIEEMNKATQRAEQAIDDALAFVKASNKRIRKMETEGLDGDH